jgi:hypothetical protein
VQDRTTDRFGMPDQQAEREDAAAARAEHGRRTKPERIQQRRRIVGLLLRRGRLPAGRNGTTPVAAPVIADDRELIGMQIGQLDKVTSVARPSHDQQDRRPGTPDS